MASNDPPPIRRLDTDRARLNQDRRKRCVAAAAADDRAAIARALAQLLKLNPSNICKEIVNLLGFVSIRLKGTASYQTLERTDELTKDAVFCIPVRWHEPMASGDTKQR